MARTLALPAGAPCSARAILGARAQEREVLVEDVLDPEKHPPEARRAA